VAPERITGWIESFAQRHGGTAAEPGSDVVVFRAADGAVAECHVPFPPLRVWPTAGGSESGGPATGGPAIGGAAAGGAVPGAARQAELIALHSAADRTVGVLLVRLGGYAAGVFTGAPPRLVASKVGARLVHGRSAAGGQSQQRFARRREKQAANALSAAADTAVAVLGPHLGRLDAVVLGGDRRTIGGLRSDPRLGPYFDRAVDRFLTVPDPRLAVLRETPRMFRSVRIRITDSEGAGQ
jgi:Actinobacteria/chloroflexi VLRF1 release factor